MDRLRWLKPDPDAFIKAGSNKHVHFARVILPSAAGLLLLGTIIWAQLSPETEVKQADLTNVQNKLETARFTSVDSQGRPFVIEADQVLQQNPSSMTATLDQPKGSITMQKNDVLSVRAKEGIYDHPNQTLSLKGDVVLDRNKNMTLTTESLNVDLKDRSATGNQPVQGSGTDGSQLQAQGLDMGPDGKTVVFKGPARLTLQPKQKKIETQ